MNELTSLKNKILTYQAHSPSPVSMQQLQTWSNETKTTIHLAIMHKTYLDKVCTGTKTIESRLNKVKIAPFDKAFPGDIILFKLSAGPVKVLAVIEKTLFIKVSAPAEVLSLAKKFSDSLGYEKNYAESKLDAKFASLLWLKNTENISPFLISKNTQQAWVIFKPSYKG